VKETLYIKALLFAMEKHKHQFRDKTGDGDPYIIHPIRVAERIRDFGFEREEPIVVAALLHDTIEDCGVNRGTIQYEFGEEVAEIVVGMTDNNCLVREERKLDTLARISRARWEVQFMKMADRMDNITDKTPQPHHKRYLGETDALLKVITTKVEDEGFTFILEMKRLLEEEVQKQWKELE
jgi:(p)ppGpp synthase/HD superfamily hydrolase